MNMKTFFLMVRIVISKLYNKFYTTLLTIQYFRFSGGGGAKSSVRGARATIS